MSTPPRSTSAQATAATLGLGDTPGLSGATGVARYHQLASLLRHQITTGTWQPGHRLPTVERLAEEFGVARITVRQAYAQLAQEELITSERGRGTYVSSTPAGPSPGLHAAINDPIRHPEGLEIALLSTLREQSLPAELTVGEAVPDEAYVRLDKIHRHAGEPFCLIQLYVPQAEFDRFPEGAERTAKVGRLLLEHGDVPLDQLHQTMTVAPADAAQAKALNYIFAGPIARVVRRITDTEGRVVYAGIFWYRGDRFVLDVVLPADLMYRYPLAVVPAPRP